MHCLVPASATYFCLDIDGNPLRCGDRVLVLAVPVSIAGMAEDTKESFSRAVGEVLQILDFGEDACVELDMIPPRFRGWNTIWVEPFLVKRIGWSPRRDGRMQYKNSFDGLRRKALQRVQIFHARSVGRSIK
jgi:hypothetical protein